VAGLGIFLILVLIFRLKRRSEYGSIDEKSPRLSDKVLLSIVCLLTIQSMGVYFFLTKPEFSLSSYMAFWIILTLCLWPLFYIYVKLTASRISKFNWNYLLYLFTLLIILLPVIILAESTQQELTFSRQPFFPPPLMKGNLDNKTATGFQPRPIMMRGPRNKRERAFLNSDHPRDFIFRQLRISLKRIKRSLLQVDLVLFLNQGYPSVLSQNLPEPFHGKPSPPSFVDGLKPKSLKRISLISGGSLIFVWVFIVLMVIQTLQYSKRINSRATITEKKNLMWLFALVVVFIVTNSMFTMTSIFKPLNGNGVIFRLNPTIPLHLFYLLTISCFVFLTRKSPLVENKYGKNAMCPEELERNFHHIMAYIITNKPYLDDMLTQKQLADALNIHHNALSQVINKKQKCNFKDFINHFRVEEFKKALLNPKNEHRNILAIAHDSGFSSKSSFNHIFKKHTSMTPSEYLKKNNGN
jgi:AraC-like DNA-binding protein